MTMSEVEVDRITQRVYTALNRGLNDALVGVVIDEIEKATEAQAAKLSRVEAVVARWNSSPLHIAEIRAALDGDS